MHDQLNALLKARRGHFQMESGYHSDAWFDLEVFFERRETLRPFVVALAERLAAHRPELICGPVTGGAKLAEAIAVELGVQWLPAHRFAPLHATGLFPVSYRIPTASRPQASGKRCVIIDDAISAGSAIRGTFADVMACGAVPVAIAALVVFGERAAQFARGHTLHLETLATLPLGMWLPDDCPLCQAGQPFELVSDASPRR